ncbi:MAG: hypothetical protein LIO77_09105 [Rikenellaceae bacterium]|nr:hypothetical protein [Rikenellaceae bacterium]
MKYNILAFFLILSVCNLASSCVANKERGGTEEEEGIPVTITVSPAHTRAQTIEGDEADYQVEDIYVLGFHTSDKTLAFREHISSQSDLETGAVINVLTGNFTVVFIANASLDDFLPDAIEDLVPGQSKLDDIRDREFCFWIDALYWVPGNLNLVPMAWVCEYVIITGNDQLIYQGKPVDGVWEVELERLAIRVDLTLDLTASQMANFKHIKFDNFPNHFTVISGMADNSSTIDNLQYSAATDNQDYSMQLGNIVPLSSGDYDYRIKYPRIILPEKVFTPADDKDEAVVLSAVIGSETFPGRIGCDLPFDYTLPRNLYLEIYATVRPGEKHLDIELLVKDWETKELYVDFNGGPYTLLVDEVDVEVPWQTGEVELKVETDYPYEWMAVLSDDPVEPEGSSPPTWINALDWNGPMTSDRTLTIGFLDNPDASERTAYLHITAGRFTNVVRIVQARFNIAEFFAKSNIIMLPDETLWFAETEQDNVTVPANAQGLMFKFGSLIGINYDAGAGNLTFASDHVVFTPIGYTAPSSWIWSDIPSYSGFNQVEDEFATAYPESTGNLGYSITDGIGDICRYISDQGWVQGRWRMPTSAELQILDGASFRSAVTDSWVRQAVTNISGCYGTATLTTGWWFGNRQTTNNTAPESGTIFLPAGGMRNYAFNGLLHVQGEEGYYWSTTAESIHTGYSLYFTSSDIKPAGYRQGAYGYSVRCIREY